MNYKRTDPNAKIAVNYVGNHLKNMLLSVEASLKKLRTTYIDILYVHWWGYDTSIEEVMNGLHTLVSQSKVLYLVCSLLLGNISPASDISLGCFERACMGGGDSKPVCSRPWKNTLLRVSRKLEYHGAFV